ncbi:unnamed protein product [Acanthosepion pharaonis]|uniref:Uncharacterized protein n=1 Tax=Acanthosepion pharaonis TaxID=158019 RepID=A0A812DFX4_ACAPH|nr:unnamed protein product [Sepia pharaonis]
MLVFSLPSGPSVSFSIHALFFFLPSSLLVFFHSSDFSLPCWIFPFLFPLVLLCPSLFILPSDPFFSLPSGPSVSFSIHAAFSLFPLVLLCPFLFILDFLFSLYLIPLFFFYSCWFSLFPLILLCPFHFMLFLFPLVLLCPFLFMLDFLSSL